MAESALPSASSLLMPAELTKQMNVEIDLIGEERPDYALTCQKLGLRVPSSAVQCIALHPLRCVEFRLDRNKDNDICKKVHLQ